MKFLIEYKHMSNIQIGVDSTDHIVFLCPNCKKALKVVNVKSIRNMVINPKDDERDSCTYIRLACHKCKMVGQRKFYWESEDGKFCCQKTNLILKKSRGEVKS